MTGRREVGAQPVSKLLQPVLVVSGLLVAALAVIAVLGVLLSVRSVSYLTGEVQPAASANDAVLQSVTDMQVAVRAYAFSGDESQLQQYRRSLDALEVQQSRLARYLDDDGQVQRLVEAQNRAVDRWLDYGRRRVDLPPKQFDEALYQSGVARFAAVKRAHRAADDALAARVDEARDAASLRLWGTVLVVGLLALAGGVLLAVLRRRLLREISDPLVRMQGVVSRMAAQDPSARARDDGPQEVRAVSRALNELADSQERARAVEQRIQDELRILDTARSDFVANVSHELRTPLTTLNGYLEMVSEEFDGDMEPHHERMMDAARRNVTRLRLLIDDLLTLSKAEASSTDVERVDLVPVVQDVVADVRLTASRRGIRIELQREGREPMLVLADKVMIYRALLNVMSNAVKFSPPDALIDVHLDSDPQQHTVEVRDHGIGIPAAELQNLGSRFFRASNAVSNEIAGTGLGVRIVQTIVDKHAGEFVINSVEGEGTSVVIKLPRQAELDPAPVPPSGTPAQAGAEPEPSGAP